MVVNGDEERGWPQDDEEESEGSDLTEMEDLKVAAEEEDGPRREQPTAASSSQMRSANSQLAPNKASEQTHSLRHKISRAGLRRLFSKKEAAE